VLKHPLVIGAAGVMALTMDTAALEPHGFS
jgi:hypothetical protein